MADYSSTLHLLRSTFNGFPNFREELAATAEIPELAAALPTGKSAALRIEFRRDDGEFTAYF
jgi:hypothetical protein